MCGIAIFQSNETGTTNVFLDYTEAEGHDGGVPIANRQVSVYETINPLSFSFSSLFLA
jgi:hypothetical protein